MTDATFSDCGRYRYVLRRIWDGGPLMCFVMLNPSTADATRDDATIRICIGRAKRMGYGGIAVVNLFALRSTDPSLLYSENNPISEASPRDYKNNLFINQFARSADIVICAWGKHGALLDRGTIVLQHLRDLGVQPYALRLNKDGSPAHPLRIGYDQQPFPF